MDEKERYTLYKARNGRCHYCGTRLNWDAFEVRGLGGGWVVLAATEAEPKDQALCYKCFEFEGRGKTAHSLVITEAKHPAVAAPEADPDAAAAESKDS